METRFEDIGESLTQAMRMGILTERNIRDIEYALRTVNDEPKESYAEFVYHDEYGQEKSYRIEPTDTIITENTITDRYEVDIHRSINGIGATNG